MASRYCVGELEVDGPLFVGDSSAPFPEKFAVINRPLAGTWQARNSIEDLGLLGTIVSSFELVHTDFISEYSRLPFYTVDNGDINITTDLAIYTEAAGHRPVGDIDALAMMCHVTPEGIRTHTGHAGGQYLLQLKKHDKDITAIRLEFI